MQAHEQYAKKYLVINSPNLLRFLTLSTSQTHPKCILYKNLNIFAHIKRTMQALEQYTKSI